MKQIIISLLILIAGFKAQAQSEDVKIIDNGPTKLVYRDTSEANRIGKKVSINFEPIGIGPIGTFETGFSAAYHINRNNLLQLEYGFGGHTMYYGTDNTTNYKGRHLGLHYKHFAGNSFYFKTGFDFRQIQLSYEDLTGPDTEAYEFEGNTIGASFTIGNQWQWENFSIGCDWFGLSAPLTKEVTSENIKVASSFAEKNMKSDQDSYLDRTNIQLLRLYVGYSF